MRVVRKIVVGLFILSIICLYVVIYAIPEVTDVLTKTETLEYGNLRIVDNVVCYFIRNETVYTAARSGNVNYYVADAIHVKKGTKILEVVFRAPDDPDAVSIYGGIIDRLEGDSVTNGEYASEFNGITSYFIDGYENYFTPETMRELKYKNVSGLNATPVNVVRDFTLRGEPLYKICNNREWFLVCWVDAANISKYNRGNSVTIELPEGDVKAVIEDIIEDGDKWLIVFSSNRFYDDFAKIRSAPAEVVLSDSNGIIIRNESITVSDGKVGVYIKTKSGSYVFRQIKIITTDGKNSITEVSYFYDDEGERVSTVNIHDEILRNP